ncbi:HalOD1 output domain-containing protein [Natrialbaceae archaeon A-arb3/5]
MCDRLTRHDCDPVHCLHFDPVSPEQLSSVIIRALSAVEDSPPTDIEPLYETVDLEAIERLVEHTVTAGSNGGLSVEFAVSGWDVAVTGDGQVLVYDREPAVETILETAPDR